MNMDQDQHFEEEEKIPDNLYSSYVERINVLQSSISRKSIEIVILKNALANILEEASDLKMILKIPANKENFKQNKQRGSLVPLKPKYLSTKIAFKYIHGVFSFLHPTEIFELRTLNRYFYTKVKNYFFYETDNIQPIVEQETILREKERTATLLTNQEAMNLLTKQDMTEFQIFTCPPETIARIASALVMVVENSTKGSWVDFKKIAHQVSFLQRLITIDLDKLSNETIRAVERTLVDLNQEIVRKTSRAASCFFIFLSEIIRYHKFYNENFVKRDKKLRNILMKIKENHWLNEKEELD